MDFFEYIEKLLPGKLTKSQEVYLDRVGKEIEYRCEVFMIPKIGYSLVKDFALNFNRR